MRPALKVVTGASTPRPAGRLGCLIACALLDDEELAAMAEVNAVPVGDTDAFVVAIDRWKVARERRMIADRRLARAEAEEAGRRWLRLVGVPRGQ